jgi:GAF domain-containing protein
MNPDSNQPLRAAQIRPGEYVRSWRLGFIRPMLGGALSFGLFALVTGILAAQNTITTLIFTLAYLFIVAITVFPFPYEVRVLVFLAGIFGVGVNELLFYGILSDATLFFYATVAIATLMLSPRAGWYTAGLTLFTIAIAGLAFLSGLINIPASQIGFAKLEDWLSTSAVILIFSAIIILGLQKLQTEIELGQAQTNRALEELEADRNTLEERIQLRTADLEAASKNSERRARQFEAIAQVARAIASIQDLDTLLPRITHMISQHFGYYHTGIFMLDEAREYAVLKAANTEGGQKMLTRGHRLKIGQTGIVGYVAGTGNPRIALDAGGDVVFFNNPDLPKTRSEMALPLRIGGELIGVLDAQSEITNAFTQEDVEALSTLADQVSIAIQNAGSFHEARTLLAEAQTTTSNYVTQAWKILRPVSSGPGYQTSGSVIKPLEKPLEGEHIQQAMKTNKTVAQSNSLTVPIRLRGQVIGVINLQVPQNHAWNVDEVDIAEAVAERLSLALETSTLLKATQHRADIERITADISGKLSASNRMEIIIQTAAEELSRALGGSDVMVQIEPIQSEIKTRDVSKDFK